MYADKIVHTLVSSRFSKNSSVSIMQLMALRWKYGDKKPSVFLLIPMISTQALAWEYCGSWGGGSIGRRSCAKPVRATFVTVSMFSRRRSVKVPYMWLNGNSQCGRMYVERLPRTQKMFGRSQRASASHVHIRRTIAKRRRRCYRTFLICLARYSAKALILLVEHLPHMQML